MCVFVFLFTNSNACLKTLFLMECIKTKTRQKKPNVICSFNSHFLLKNSQESSSLFSSFKPTSIPRHKLNDRLMYTVAKTQSTMPNILFPEQDASYSRQGVRKACENVDDAGRTYIFD